MKMCTRWKLNKDGEPRKVLDVSIVSNDHQFGFRDGELHNETALPKIGRTEVMWANHDITGQVV